MDIDRNRDLMYFIHSVSKLTRNILRQKSERIGMSESYRPLMVEIVRKPGLSQVELVELTHLKAPTISLTLAKMEEEQLIERIIDTKDHRSIRIYPCEKGYELDKNMKDLVKQTSMKCMEGLDEQEIEQAKETLIKIIHNIQEKEI